MGSPRTRWIGESSLQSVSSTTPKSICKLEFIITQCICIRHVRQNVCCKLRLNYYLLGFEVFGEQIRCSSQEGKQLWNVTVWVISPRNRWHLQKQQLASITPKSTSNQHSAICFKYFLQECDEKIVFTNSKDLICAIQLSKSHNFKCYKKHLAWWMQCVC